MRLLHGRRLDRAESVPNLLRQLTAGLAMAVVSISCAPAVTRSFEVTLQGSGQPALHIVLFDDAQVVDGVEPLGQGDQWGYGDPVVVADPVDPAVLVLTWAGGACSRDGEITLRNAGGGYTLHLTASGTSGNCTGAAVDRGVRIRTTPVLDPAQFTISGGG